MSSNRVLDLKWKRQAQEKHIRNLRSVKSLINTSAPKTYSFLDSRPKARQLKFGTIFLMQKNREISTTATQCWCRGCLTCHRRSTGPESSLKTHSILLITERRRGKYTAATSSWCADFRMPVLSTPSEGWPNR